jgi:hypothetical protein
LIGTQWNRIQQVRAIQRMAISQNNLKPNNEPDAQLAIMPGDWSRQAGGKRLRAPKDHGVTGIYP